LSRGVELVLLCELHRRVHRGICHRLLLLGDRRGWGSNWQLGKGIDVNSISSLLELISHINTLLGCNQINQLIAVFTDDNGPEVASDVVPLDSIVVLIVQNGQTRFVVELLQTLNRDSNIVVRLNWALLFSLEVIRLSDPIFSCGRPEGVGVWFIGGRDAGITGSGPEPTVDVDRLKMGPIAPFILEVAFSTTCPNAGNVIFFDDVLEHFELQGGVEGDQVHASIPAEVPSVEPVPVLKLVPGLPPGKEIIMISNFHV